ncbi:MOFRL family protein [Deinococcus radiodurans]|uniref:MOFRL family protein n=1 Tax=Deinococcus radiodurans TaxID=1299 RepID=UPI0013E8F0AB
MRGDGAGGRNQEFALALALALGEDGVYALSAGSDGIDGSSDAAGAFLTPDTLGRARAAGLSPREFLERNDSGTFFAHLGDALVTGPSGHNLNDFRALLVGA